MKSGPVSINMLIRPLKPPTLMKAPRQRAMAFASSERARLPERSLSEFPLIACLQPQRRTMRPPRRKYGITFEGNGKELALYRPQAKSDADNTLSGFRGPVGGAMGPYHSIKIAESARQTSLNLGNSAFSPIKDGRSARPEHRGGDRGHRTGRRS